LNYAANNLSLAQDEMTPSQIEKGQDLASAWLASKKTLTPRQELAAKHYVLGRNFAVGQEVKKDLVQAYMWWSISAEQGNADAKRGLKIIEDQITPSQIEKAQDLSRECVAKNYKDC
jgi:TPR repeat protein